jgi:hypothetical protein
VDKPSHIAKEPVNQITVYCESALTFGESRATIKSPTTRSMQSTLEKLEFGCVYGIQLDNELLITAVYYENSYLYRPTPFMLQR